MSARRQKRKKFNFLTWISIISIIVVGITFYMLNNIQTHIDEGQEQNILSEDAANSIISDNENIEENVINQEIENTLVVENEVENEVSKNNTTKNETVKNQTTSSTTANTGKYQPAVTDQKQKAIELVKEMWGSDSSVNYAFEYINEKGEYIISVKDKSSATVRNYFRVDLQTETVELD